MVERTRSPLRFLAPILLIAAALLVYAVLMTSTGGEEEEPAATSSAAERLEEGGGSQPEDGSPPKTYEVQSGDTLDAIAEETGVSAEEIQALNPDLDPQALIAGEELKLSE
jgi:LysM repeat protein